MTWNFPKHTSAGIIQCPQCGKIGTWTCWDERTDHGMGNDHEDHFDEYHDGVERVVGYMKCTCGMTWLDEDPPHPLPEGYFEEEKQDV